MRANSRMGSVRRQQEQQETELRESCTFQPSLLKALLFQPTSSMSHLNGGKWSEDKSFIPESRVIEKSKTSMEGRRSIEKFLND